MGTNQIRAEVFNLEGMKVHICKNIDQMDLSKLVEDVYMISYVDNHGNILWNEKYVKAQKPQHVFHT